jgi:circadian clock protein KaiB
MKSETAIRKVELMERLVLQLYVSGMSQRSMEAINNVRHFCDEHFDKDSFDLEIIDLYKDPELAKEQQIVFSPSLVKQKPLPRKMLVGNFSNTEKVMTALGLAVNS